jgi:hypothetical protein
LLQPLESNTVNDYIQFFSEGSIEEFIHAWQNKHYSEKYGNFYSDLPGLLNIEFEGKAIKGIVKKELGLPNSTSSDIILEEYGQNLMLGKEMLDNYFNKGQEWRNDSNTHPSYKGIGYKQTNQQPDLLIQIINANK